MPDTTTSTPRIARRSNLLLVLAAISVTFMLFYPHLVSAQEDSDTTDQSCLGATTVETFEGSTSVDETAPFNISTDTFQVAVETTPTNNSDTASTSVFVNDSNFTTLTSKDFGNLLPENSLSGTITVENNGAGPFTLTIFPTEASYDITVQECGGSAGGGNPVDPDPGNIAEEQYVNDEEVQTPATGGPPLSVVAAILLWFGVGGILVTRRFA